MEFKQVTAPGLRAVPARSAYASISEQKRWIRRYEESGLNQMAFCRENNLNVKTFGRWKRKFDVPPPLLTETALSLEATVKPSRQQVHCVLPNGINFEFGLESELLSQFVRELCQCKFS